MSQFDFTEENIDAAPVVKAALHNSTVVSILPYPIKEQKPSIIPSYFQVPRSRDGIPSVLQVGEAIYWVESPFSGNPPPPPIKVTIPSREVARSIVNDLIEAQLAIESDALPGIFWVEGHFTADEVMFRFASDLKKAEDNQFRWFSTLVRIADDDWAKYHQHKFISDLQRYAARSMMLNREWITPIQSEVQLQCPLCKDFVRSDAIIHAPCGYILRPDEYKQLQSQGLILEKQGASK